MANRVLDARDNNNSHISAQRPKMVYLRAVFAKIGEIDTVKEYFSAEVLIEARWREPLFDGLQTQLDKSGINWQMCWDPKLSVQNGVGDLKETTVRDVYWTLNGDGMVVERRWIKGSLVENLELWNFPFDAQDLSVSIISTLPSTEVELTQDDANASSINKFVFVDEQEWELDTRVHSIKKLYNQSDSEGAGTVQRSCIDFFCKATRRSGFFVWNIFFVLFFICAMTFTTFAVVYTKPENRLQLTFILLLTTVAFRSNVNSSLPKISYLTLMDKYIIYTMIIQFIVCIWHAIVGGALHCLAPCVLTVSPETAFWADKIVFIVLISFFIISAVAFFLYAYFMLFWKNKRHSNNEVVHPAPTYSNLKGQDEITNVFFSQTNSHENLAI